MKRSFRTLGILGCCLLVGVWAVLRFNKTTQTEVIFDSQVSINSEASLSASPKVQKSLGYIEELKTCIKDDAGVEEAISTLAIHLHMKSSELTNVFASLEAESDPRVIALLSRVVADHFSASKSRTWTDSILRLAETSVLPRQRQAGLQILCSIPEVTPRALQTAGRIARSDSDLQVRMSALDTLEIWRNRHHEQVTAINEVLSEVISQSQDPTLKNHANNLLAQSKENSEPFLPASASGKNDATPQRTESGR